MVKAPVEWLFDANISLCKLLGKLCAVTLDNKAASMLTTAALLSLFAIHCSASFTVWSLFAIHCSVSFTVWSKVKICIAHHCEHASDALPLPVSRCWSLLASLCSQALAPHYKTRDVPVYCPSFRKVLITACQRVGSGWLDLRAWFCAEVVYPSKDGIHWRYSMLEYCIACIQIALTVRSRWNQVDCCLCFCGNDKV